MAVLFGEVVLWKEIAGNQAGDVAASSRMGTFDRTGATDDQPGSRRTRGSLPAGVHLVLET
jgi:hypothetical protein